MASAVVSVEKNDGDFITARALLDSCSTVNLITKRFADGLKIPIDDCAVSIGAINNLSTAINSCIQLKFRSIHNDFQKVLTFLIVPQIAERVPDEIFPRHLLQIPANIKLADPQFHIPRPIDILINAGTTLSLLSIGQINVGTNNSDIVLQKTKLGWVVAGGLNTSQEPTRAKCHLTSLENQIKLFWTIEDLDANSTLSSDEAAAENHYIANTRRDETGKYVVRLPFRSVPPNLGKSREQALTRFYALERKLNSNPMLKEEYIKVMNEYKELGHVSLVDDESADGYYLPHHPVIKETSDTTKVRVVFDASAKTTNGTSLNETLLTGPTIQPNIFEQVLKFRKHQYVITADIAKMFRMVLVHPEDRKYQRIFWYHDGQIRVFELNIVTFGESCSLFLAVRSLQQLARDEASKFPRASKILLEDMYVDDLITGADSTEEILKIRDEVISLLKLGGFDMRQWSSNNPLALDNIKGYFIDLDHVLKEKIISKTLGVVWNSQRDSLTYTTNQSDPTSRVTKRILLSEISKIFDPLGLLGPVVLYAKTLIQECWKLKVHWDESLPQDLHQRWSTFAEQLPLLRKIEIERCVLLPKSMYIEIHGFCDACLYGYGACIYIVSVDESGNRTVKLACAKSKVAPISGMTIPRLELCAASTLVKLYNNVCETLKLDVEKSICWSDSTIVLQWLKKSPRILKVFESNRVRDIQKFDEKLQWRHVKSADNPADALSRGQTPLEFVSNDTWFKGPFWLALPEEEWPSGAEIIASDLPGLKQDFCLLSTESDKNFFSRFSSYRFLIKVVVRILRWRKLRETKNDPITVTEKDEAEQKVLRMLQQQHFAGEINRLSKENRAETVENAARTRFDNLSPFIGEHGLLRVGGRLKRANLTYNQKHPVLLPSNNHVSDLIIRGIHEDNFHAGVQTTLYTLRSRYWVCDGKNQVRRIVKKCVVCIRERPNSLHSKMADLPSPRVNEAAPFYHVGIDFFGPIYLKERKEKNRTILKAYGCVFVCMACKAVHIELTSNLTTEGFLAAFNRFISRRGIPGHVYSDNGTNFIGANNQLKELFALFKSEKHNDEINNYALAKNITWHFNPPLSPHFGGLWEAAVKSFKFHLKRVLKDHLLTYEELNSLLIDIEGILNSRPLIALSADPNDPLAIAPAHVLIGRQINTLPEKNLLPIPDNRLSSWNFMKKARQDFWARWHVEYLNELQKRQKWLHSNGKIEPNSVVILIDKNVPCARWPLGVILETSPGSDGIVRVATVKTTTGIYKRNITSLCVLPVNQNIC